MKSRYNPVLIAIIAIGLIVSLWLNYQRHEIEQRNDTVEMAMEYEGLEHIANWEGLSFPIVALFLLPAACHRTDGRAEALLNNADSLLTANPDSALRLLEKTLGDEAGGNAEASRTGIAAAQIVHEKR